MSLIYLVTNYITHKLNIPIILANVLRLLISCLDSLILLILLFRYIFEWCYMAYEYSIIGVLFSIFICVLNWAIFVRQDERVQPVFIIGTFCFIVLFILYCQFISMGLGYKGILSPLFMFNIIYMSCWLIFDPYAKAITRFMEHVGNNLSWIDPLIGDMPHKEVALRNLCSFNLGLLNFTYIHVSGGANIVLLISVGLGLLANLLIGLRLIKVSAYVTLKHGFIVQIMKHAYNNIAQIYVQLKKGQLPKATWYAWAMVLIMGLVFTSPSYAMSIEANKEGVNMLSPFEIDESQNQEIFKTADSGEPLGESYWRRSSSYAKEFFEHNVSETLKKVKSAPADFLYGAAKTGAVAGAGAIAKMGYDSIYGADAEIADQAGTSTQRPSYDELMKAHFELTTANADLTKTNAELVKDNLAKSKTILALQQKSSWSSWFKTCWKGSTSE